MGICTARHIPRIERFGMIGAGNAFDTHNAFMRRLVGQPGRAGQIADGIETFDACAPEIVDFDMGLLDLHAKRFKAEVFNIANDAHGKDRAVEFFFLFLAGLVRDFRRYGGLASFEVFDLRAGYDVQALLLEVLLGEFGNLLVFHWQDPVHNFSDSHIRAKLMIETGEFDPDGARADDEQAFRHDVWRHGFAVRPDQFLVCDKAGLRDISRPCTGGEHDMLGLVGRVLAVLAFDHHFRCRCTFFEAGGAFKYVDLVLLHQKLDAGR